MGGSVADQAEGMRILFLGKRYYTNQDVLKNRFGRIYWLPRHWHDAGIDVHLMLLDHHGWHRADSEADGFTMQSLPTCDPRSIVRLAAYARALEPDVIVASGDCFLGIMALGLARRTNACFVFDVYDDYRTFAAYKVFMGFDALGFLCRRADLVLYASRRMADGHDFASSCVVVPNGVEGAAFAPSPMAEARAKLGLPMAGRLVGYFGSMTAEYGVDVLMRASHKLRASQPDLQLLLCGPQNPATPVSGEGILYRGIVPHDMIPTYLNACDVLALPYRRGAFIDGASSCKIAEYLSCQRPIVATRTPNFVSNFPDQARQLDKLLVPPDDAEALACAIRRQLDDPVIARPPDDITWERIAARLMLRLQRIKDRPLSMTTDDDW